MADTPAGKEAENIMPAGIAEPGFKQKAGKFPTDIPGKFKSGPQAKQKACSTVICVS